MPMTNTMVFSSSAAVTPTDQLISNSHKDAIQRITTYWLDIKAETLKAPPEPHKVEMYIEKNFQVYVEMLEDGELEHWRLDHMGRIAYIICAGDFAQGLF